MICYDNEAPVAFLAERNHASINALKTLLLEGKTVAICPYNDPIPVIKAWLKELQISTIMGPKDDAKFEALKGVTKIPMSADVVATKNILQKAVTILKTSGTTGAPKSALIRGEAHLASARAVNNYFKVDEQSSFGLGLPLHHVSGLSIIFRSLLAKNNIISYKGLQELKELIDREQITHVSLVPTQLNDLLLDPPKKNTLKAIILGGDRVPPTLIEQCLEKSWPLYGTYGLTETASMVYVHDHRTGKGEVLPHAHLCCENGEIKVKSHSLFSGYVCNGISDLPVDEKGFFATGDLGSITDNQLTIMGRNHHRIISGGENIQLEEIEEVLLRHEDIEDCVAIGIPDERFQEVVAVFVRMGQNAVSIERLRTFLMSHLPSFKIPKRILPWPLDPLPEGKSRRQAIKKIYHTKYRQTSF